jgi:hypothetical protein
MILEDYIKIKKRKRHENRRQRKSTKNKIENEKKEDLEEKTLLKAVTLIRLSLYNKKLFHELYQQKQQ